MLRTLFHILKNRGSILLWRCPKQTNKQIMNSKTAQISNYFSEKSPSQDFIFGTLDATPQTAYHSIALWWWSITCAKVAHKVQKVIGWSQNVLSALQSFSISSFLWLKISFEYCLHTLWVTFLKIISLVLLYI